MFFHPLDVAGEQYGTGRPEFEDVAECVTRVPQPQSDHEQKRRGVTTGNTAGDLRTPGEGP